MKYIRTIIKVLSILLLVISFAFSSIQYHKMNEINQAYDQYMNEETEIIITLNGLSGSLSDKLEYPSSDDYQSRYHEVMKLYNNISDEDIVKNMNISNYLIVNLKWDKNWFLKEEFKLIGIHELDHLKIVQGRNITQEEINEGKHVIVLNSLNNKRINIGEKVEIYCPSEYLNGTTIQEYEVVGFYESSDQYEAYVANSSISELSNKWISEVEDNSNYSVFYPLGIHNPKIIVYSETEYDQIQNLIYQYNKGSSFNFVTTRNEEHLVDLRQFNTSEYYNKMIISLSISLVLLIIIISLEIKQFIFRKNEQKQFEYTLMKEQEKNVQNIISMNKDTYKLKHDLKHFFQQLLVYVKNNENDKVIELLEDYYQDIQELELPVYTQNRTIDMLINHYSHKAKEMNINFTYSSTLIYDLEIKERKLYILLSNALENAFIHCDIRKVVRMEIATIEPYTRFTIMNTIDINQQETTNHDKEHGHGLISMKQIVNEVDGEMNVEIQEDMYICTILIPVRR